jgi:hypothetical protein
MAPLRPLIESKCEGFREKLTRKELLSMGKRCRKRALLHVSYYTTKSMHGCTIFKCTFCDPFRRKSKSLTAETRDSGNCAILTIPPEPPKRRVVSFNELFLY